MNNAIKLIYLNHNKIRSSGGKIIIDELYCKSTITLINKDNYSNIRAYANGNKFWYLNDKLHREDGPAIVWPNGDKEWWVNGLRHREDGPAVVCVDDSKRWYLNGLKHREDGPSSIWADGSKFWYLDDNALTEGQFNERRNKTNL